MGVMKSNSAVRKMQNGSALKMNLSVAILWQVSAIIKPLNAIVLNASEGMKNSLQ